MPETSGHSRRAPCRWPIRWKSRLSMQLQAIVRRVGYRCFAQLSAKEMESRAARPGAVYDQEFKYVHFFVCQVLPKRKPHATIDKLCYNMQRVGAFPDDRTSSYFGG